MSKVYVFTYLGSKLRMIDGIESLSPLDTSELYEVCGGFGAFILNNNCIYEKAVYNELNPLIFNLMHVLKDSGSNEYVDRVVNMHCDKVMFDKVKKEYTNEFNGMTEPVERALAVSLLQINSYNGNRVAFVEKNRSLDWKKNTRRRLKEVSGELQGIELENRDCFEILAEQRDNLKAFIFMDIPYPMDTERVTKDIYEGFDWSEELHEKAYNILKEMDGNTGCKVMLCTYRSPTYDRLLEKEYWIRVHLKDTHSPAGQKGQKRKRKNECIYINYTSFSPFAKYKFEIDETMN